MGYIYKITNTVNGKIYIGLTTVSVEHRWKQHCQTAKRGSNKHLYFSMRKYGIENFKIEQIDSTDNFEELGNLERKYIKEYNSANPCFGYNITHGGERCQLDGNPRTRLTVNDVEEIREIYSKCEIGVTECWEKYKDRISFDAFEKIYEGQTWKSVKPDVYTEEAKEIHKKMGGKKRYGEKNVNAIYSDEEVYEIRKYYVNHSLRECYEKFGEKSKSKIGFRSLIDRGYKNVPIYRKNVKRWVNPNDDVEKGRNVWDRNEIRIFENYAEIDTYERDGSINATFVVDIDMVDFLKGKKWRKAFHKDKALLQCTNGEFYNTIIFGKSRCSAIYKDGNMYNLRRENLTTKKEIIHSKITKDILYEMYIEKNMAIVSISKFFGVDRKTIKALICEYDLQK